MTLHDDINNLPRADVTRILHRAGIYPPAEFRATDEALRGVLRNAIYSNRVSRASIYQELFEGD